MKQSILIFLTLALVSTSFAGGGTIGSANSSEPEVQQMEEISVSDLELNRNGEFVQCTLKTGQKLSANDVMVVLDNKILSKNALKASRSHGAESVTYDGGRGTKIKVSKQFCARGDVTAITVTDAAGNSESSSCAKDNVSCDEDSKP